ncbi:MCE family protein [Hymenobacter sp. BT188]|uniref:MlaD family protein n=1 Tax=Hymenobacter sp. BT188 TaxID=2763504 RepID=UPI001650EDBA|nr:MlaD family protein [Hymenobacter sp. BT188]MBC6605695.1 MCE family protein [Hymenobacter sp. BT188]
MPQATASNNIRLGLFVAVGVGCLMAVLFLLGRKQNLFGSSLEVMADFRNVSGLLIGNNVRLAGIDVGTVRRIQIQNDSTVRVVMHLNRDVQPFVKKNAVASIGTDGLVGNTIVNLSAVAAPAPPVEPGDVLRTKKPLAVADMLNTLDISNKNLVGITQDLRQITSKLNGSKAIWQILDDQKLAENLGASLRRAASATASLQASAVDLQNITNDVRRGRGPAGYLLTDTAFAGRMRYTTRQLASSSDTLAATMASLKQQVQTSGGPLNTLLVDTAMSQQLRRTLQNVEKGTEGFNQSMEALQHNFLLRGYFRRQQKKQAQAATP